MACVCLPRNPSLASLSSSNNLYAPRKSSCTLLTPFPPLCAPYPHLLLSPSLLSIRRCHSLMNCTYPLEESILMDFVPKNTRARWKSLDSVATFGWCGSSALGGYLADLHGYAFTFLITAGVQLLATSIQALLICLVPRQEEQQAVAAVEPIVMEPQREAVSTSETNNQ